MLLEAFIRHALNISSLEQSPLRKKKDSSSVVVETEDETEDDDRRRWNTVVSKIRESVVWIFLNPIQASCRKGSSQAFCSQQFHIIWSCKLTLFGGTSSLVASLQYC
jgi:hypothetical protein